MANAKSFDKLAVTAKRKLLKSKLSQAVYRPRTHDELMEKWHDEKYVQLLEKDAERKRRVSKDPLAPNDATRNRFWVLRGVCIKGLL